MRKLIYLGILVWGVLAFNFVTFAADSLDKKPNIESETNPEVFRDEPIYFQPSPTIKNIEKKGLIEVDDTSAVDSGINLISNPSVENSNSSIPQNWLKGGYGSNTRTLTYPTTGLNGGKAITINLSNHSSGDVKWYFDDVPVKVGSTYKFSDYYISDTTSIIDVRYKLNDGTYQYVDIAHLEPNPGSNFKKVTVEFTVPKNVVSVTVFHLINTNGFLTTDEFSLVETTIITPPVDKKNLIPNPEFEEVSGAIPLYWKKGGWGTNTRTYSYPVTSYDGSKAAQVNITNYTSGDAKWYFEPLSVPSGSYTYSEIFSSNIKSAITVQYQNTDNTYRYVDVAKLEPTGSSYKSVSVNIPVSENTKNITIFHLIQGVGTLTMDTASLKAKEISGVFDTGAVTFRFDDGLVSQYQNAVPKLNSYGFNGTFYITSQQLFENGFTGFFNKDQLKEIYEQGHEIGAHTRTHAHLTQLTASQQTNEIQGSRQDLINMGLGEVNSFSYPFGEYNAGTIQVVKDAGFSNAVATINGYVSPSSDIYQLERTNIILGTKIDEIKSAVDKASAEKRWLVFAIHGIDNSGGAYTTTKEIFDQAVDYVHQKNIPVVTIEEGMKSF